MAKVVLAYSGTLDTEICLHWLKARGMRVIAYSADVGQPEDLESLGERALSRGVSAAHIADLRERFATEFVFPTLRAGAVYEEGYHLFSALSRPLIVEGLVALAEDEGCTHVAHGARGAGNDAVRIQTAVSALAPHLNVLLPLQELGLNVPEDDLRYARDHGLPVDSERRTLFNVEQNLWGVNVQIRETDPWDPPPAESHVLTVPPDKAPDRPVTLTVDFEKGVPVALDGKPTPPVKLIETLNRLGGRHAIGRFDLLETRLSGRKTREVYEAPAAAILYTGLRALEALVFDREVLEFKEPLARRYASLVYRGHWFSPFRRGLESFFQSIADRVTGSVRFGLGRGRLTVEGRKSPNAIVRARRDEDTDLRGARK